MRRGRDIPLAAVSDFLTSGWMSSAVAHFPPMRRIAIDLLIYLLDLLFLSSIDTSSVNFLLALTPVATYEYFGWLGQGRR